ncbi:hypothetical protein KIN20_028101, partial [Parelaphostrongylus tenuis]
MKGGTTAIARIDVKHLEKCQQKSTTAKTLRRGPICRFCDGPEQVLRPLKKAPVGFQSTENVKINAATYQQQVSRGLLKPWTAQHFDAGRILCFQQCELLRFRHCHRLSLVKSFFQTLWVRDI